MHTIHHVLHTAMRRTSVVLSIALLGATGVSASATQSAATSSAKAKPAQLNIMLMKPTAATTGDNQFEVMVKGADGKPVADADVSLGFYMAAMPAMKMPEMKNTVTLKHESGGVYRGSGQVMMAGQWDVTIVVKRNGQQIGTKKVKLTAK